MAATKKPLLSVIIPVFNEAKTIQELIRKVSDVVIDKEIIVICDGSTDGTKEILEGFKINKQFNHIIFLFHGKNLGKGAAVRTALKHARGKITLIQDADLEQDPEDYHVLLKPLISRKTQVVFGSRFKKGWSKISLLSKIANKTVTFLANILYGASITDAACGYKVMSTKLYKSLNLESNRFDICPEIIAKLKKRGYILTEVPVKFFPRGKKDGKKIKWYDGFIAVYTYFKYLLL